MEHDSMAETDHRNVVALSAKLRAFRSSKGWALRRLAEETGRDGPEYEIPLSTLSRLENGRVKQPDPATLVRLAHVTGIPFEEWVAAAGYDVDPARLAPNVERTDRLLRALPQAARLLDRFLLLTPDEQGAFLAMVEELTRGRRRR